MYEYDVFISFERNIPTVGAWVRSFFAVELTQILDDLVDYEVHVFTGYDVPAGTVWPPRIRDAFQRARILIPVLRPKYFQDEWCLAEWYSMARREQITGMEAQGLICPVVFSDSENFPDYAHARRMYRLTDYNHHLPHFQQTSMYFEFREKVREIAEGLVPLFEKVPDWRPDWPVELPTPEPPRRSKLPRF